MNSRCPTKPSRPVSLQPDLAMTAEHDGLSAAEIAAAVAGRKMSALGVTEAALARIAKHDPVLNAFTDVTADRARAKARAVDAAIAAGKNAGPLAGVPFAVKNLFDVQGLPTRAGSKINRDLQAVAARRHPDRAHGSRRRGAGRRAQHGRIRLRLHRRECARRSVAQSARRDADDRRLVGRLRRRGRRRPGAAGAGLRHQRLDPGAVVVLRNLRTEADLRPAVARAFVSVRRKPRSSRSVRAQRRRSRAGL